MQVIVMRMIVTVMLMVVMVLMVVGVVMVTWWKKRDRLGGGVQVAGDADASESDGYGNAIGEC